MQQMGSCSRWTRGPVLGRGSTATVSLATSTSTSTSTVFAVKSADLHNSAPLQREQRLLSSIPSSPHLISYLGFDLSYEGGNGGRTLFNLFLEYAPGGSLSDQYIAGKGLEEEHEMRRYTRGILMGLSHLHSLGVAHCDVKPRNVLLAADGSAKLADFGCSMCVSGVVAGERQPAVAGTPLFMSPETARGEEQGTAADIWALGCTVIEMATGRAPWPDVHDALSAVHHIGFTAKSPEIPTWLSAEARDFLSKCLERDPHRRSTADELLCHPFVAAAPGPDRRSPKCVLDWDMWDSLKEEEEDGREEGTSLALSDPCERIRQLTVESSGSTMGSDYVWDNDDNDGGWIPVRSAKSAEAPTAMKASVDGSLCENTLLGRKLPLGPNCGDCLCHLPVNCKDFYEGKGFCCLYASLCKNSLNQIVPAL